MLQKTIQVVKTFISTYSKYITTIIVLILLALVYFFYQKSVNNKISADNWKAKYQYEHQVTDSIRNSLGQKVAQQDVVITHDKKFIQQLSDSAFKLTKAQEKKVKEVDALVRENQQLKINNVFVPFDSTASDTTKYVADSNSKITISKDSIIIPPKKFQYLDSSFNVKGQVLLKGIQFDTVVVNDTVSFRIIKTKAGLFKKQKVQVQIIHSNKYFETKNIQSIILQPQESKWNRIYKPIIFGVFGFAIKALL